MRTRKFGDVELPTNSRAMDDPRYVDQSRMRTKPEEIPGNDPRGKNEAIKIPSGLKAGVEFSVGTMRHRSMYESKREYPDPKGPAGVKPGGGDKK